MSNINSNNPGSYTDLFRGFKTILDNYMKRNVATCQPVRIVNVNAENAFVDVQSVLLNADTDGNIYQSSVIPNVPVCMMFGNSCEITFEVSVGDFGLLIASKQDISNFKNNKGDVEIASHRSFNWSDGFFLPLTFKNVEKGIRLKNKDSLIEILPDALNITSKNIVINGDVEVNGQIKSTDDILAGDISLKEHTHKYIDTQPNGAPSQKDTEKAG